MEKLRNLNELAKSVVKNFNDNFNPEDCKIPQAFKDKVKTLKSFYIVYNDYSVIIKGDGVRSKDSYVPNQIFYMASFFIEYSYELSKYKQKIMRWISNAGISTNELTAFFTHERDKGKEDIANSDDKFIQILDDIGYNEEDRDFLIKFVTDYDWWSGSKTIERSDFFNSPVLSVMGLTASSNAAMALIVDHLTQHPELSNLLLKQINNEKKNIGTLQQIFYGAPGTGKSNTIKREVDEKKKKHFRTTFHPDSDYSTFVGAYKPTMRPVADKYKAVAGKDEEITYSFVPQAFTKAYIEAWNTEEEVYLIIEEINRGNCAQIFGDLFQLLDRDKNGESEYPIDADADLANYIADALNESPRDDISDEVKSGKKLKLPRNLYIWATMNTSDQSLFPIDSAFKRRWDWKYIPIKPHNENYIIEIDKTQYDWWGFLEKINYVIDKTTSSEDKKLGYFFVKANNNTIDADKFVSKVLFYIWNDVFKNYEFDHEIFNKGEDKKFSFSDFFEQDGKPNVNEVKEFLKNLDGTIDKENSFVIPNNQEKKEDNNNTGEEGTEE